MTDHVEHCATCGVEYPDYFIRSTAADRIEYNVADDDELYACNECAIQERFVMIDGLHGLRTFENAKKVLKVISKRTDADDIDTAIDRMHNNVRVTVTSVADCIVRAFMGRQWALERMNAMK